MDWVGFSPVKMKKGIDKNKYLCVWIKSVWNDRIMIAQNTDSLYSMKTVISCIE